MSDLIPPDVVTCPECGSQIAMLDDLEDTTRQQVRSWVCLSTECVATGWIALAIASTRHRPTAAPERPIITPRHWRAA